MNSIDQPLFGVKATPKATDQLMSATTEQTITSLEVAELTGKQHKHVLADIRNIISQLGEGPGPNFRPGSYKDAQNQERPMFNLTKEGCICLVSGYDANLRMKIISADLQQVAYGDGGGTWFHEDVALEYARCSKCNHVTSVTM